MRALDRKLFRDLWQLRAQAIAIALVIAAGTSIFVMFRGTLDALSLTRADYYAAYRFADVFASLKRAPESLAGRIAEIPGVAAVETRVVAPVKVRVPGFAEPVTGRLVATPEGREPLLNGLHLVAGRLVAPRRDDEVVLADSVAQAHRLGPGDRLSVVVNGRQRTLTIVGTALSPEYVHQLRPGGLFPDHKRYAVLWMGREALASAYDMEGAFNDVALRLYGQTHPQVVIDRLDGLLGPYGGLGAYAREHQPSHRFLSEELRQLETSGTLFPAIFLGVAAFLLNVVVGRLVAHQREQIASLKAFGYDNTEIVVHYLGLASLVVLAGVVLGVAVGAWLGRGLAELYTEFFRFPFLRYRLSAAVLAQAGAVNLLAALVGAALAVRAAARLRPAEAMRPEPPGRYRPALAERLGLSALLSPAARMALRNVERRPVRSLLSVLGIALACGITMVAGFQEATVNRMLDVQFRLSRREDLSVTFVEPAAPRAARSLAALEGVLRVETFRAVPVRLRHQHRSFRTTLRGQVSGGDLERLLDTRLERVDLPRSGVVLTDYLGELLEARPGDLVTVEVLEGHRPVRRVPIASLVPEYLGVSAYMDLEALGRLLGEGPAISGAYLAVDEAWLARVYERLDEMPRVAGAVVREREIEGFHRTMDRTMLFFTFIASVFAVIIAFGVVYNIARIALTERSRDLGSLRVLGFTRAEVGRILLGELGLITLIGIPLGFGVGAGISAYFVLAFRSELYRLPLVIEPRTYAFAATVVMAAAAFSAWVVRRRLDRLDLVSILKTRD